MEIRHPEWLQVEINKQKTYGYNQEWYGTSFRRTRGCGPTAATMLLLYLNRREVNSIPTYHSDSISSITKVMDDVWEFITPGWLLGLNSTGKFSRGMANLLRHYKLNWQCHECKVPEIGKRPSLAEVIKFLERGIAADCPIAFLNLHRGQAIEVDNWHWIVIISLLYDAEQGRYMATCYDGGRSLTFDVGLWLESTKIGGGFAYVEADTSGSK